MRRKFSQLGLRPLPEHLVWRLFKGMVKPDSLSTMVLLVTDACNARCAFCYNTQVRKASKREKNRLELGEYEAIAKRNGPLLQVIIGGGEPFLRDDLVEIASAFYHHAQTRLFSIPTNGFRMESIASAVASMIRECPEALFNIMVSIDAMGQRHDELRNLKGAFAQALVLLETLAAMREKGKQVNPIINTVISEDNIDDIPDLQNFLYRQFRQGFTYHNLAYDQRLESRLFLKKENHRKVIQIEDRYGFFRNQQGSDLFTRLVNRYYQDSPNRLLFSQHLREKPLFRCNAGRKLCVVFPDGVVSPCEPMVFEKTLSGSKLPNLRSFDYRYSGIRADHRFTELLASIKQGKCGTCYWSCAVISSLLYSPVNWPRFFLPT